MVTHSSLRETMLSAHEDLKMQTKSCCPRSKWLLAAIRRSFPTCSIQELEATKCWSDGKCFQVTWKSAPTNKTRRLKNKASKWNRKNNETIEECERIEPARLKIATDHSTYIIHTGDPSIGQCWTYSTGYMSSIMLVSHLNSIVERIVRHSCIFVPYMVLAWGWAVLNSSNWLNTGEREGFVAQLLQTN